MWSTICLSWWSTKALRSECLRISCRGTVGMSVNTNACIRQQRRLSPASGTSPSSTASGRLWDFYSCKNQPPFSSPLSISSSTVEVWWNSDAASVRMPRFMLCGMLLLPFVSMPGKFLTSSQSPSLKFITRIWSMVFHARDFPVTELFDYVFAYSMVLASFWCMIMRWLLLDPFWNMIKLTI